VSTNLASTTYFNEPRETSVSNHRGRMSVVATLTLLMGGCSVASPTGSPLLTPTSAPTTVTSSGASAATSSPTPTEAAVRPGYLLLEHFGNGADGTPTTDNDRRHLWLVKADGTDLHELTPEQPMGEGGHGAWAPNGIDIAYDAEPDVIYVTDVNGTTPRLVTTSCPATTCGDRYPAYSPDGKLLAFVRQTRGSKISGVIAIRNLATGKVTNLESTLQMPPANEMGRPAWSPDGTHIAYYVVPKDIYGPDVAPLGTSVIYIVNADDSGLHALKTPGLAAGDPAWSPDGSLIVFSTTPLHEWATHGVDPSPNVYVIHADGTGLTQLTHDYSSGAPSWTSDGKILFSNVDNDHDPALWLMDADGRDLTRIGPGSMRLLSDTTGYTYYAYWQPMP
jgi:Tol biopolymer transport system component